MPIPKSVKIGTQVWEISEQKRKHSVTNDHFGFTSPTNNTIVLDSEQAPSMKRVTLFHELLHAIKITFGGSFQPGKGTSFEEFEHYFIGLYEEPVVLMLRDNPELAEYLLGGND
jgi:hypothetical protein